MFRNAKGNPRKYVVSKAGQANCLPVVLLYGLAVAVVLCVAVIAVFYGYWLTEGSVSKYRRQMNASAYSAQIFFDQREQLLRSTVTLAVRNLKGRSVSQTPQRLGPTEQVEVFPLLDEPNQYEWALVLTPRNVALFHQMQAGLIYTSRVSGMTQYVLDGNVEHVKEFPIDMQQWIREMLELKEKQSTEKDGLSVVWLAPPSASPQSLLMFIQVDEGNLEAGWLGLVLPDIASRIDLSDMEGGSYALYAPSGMPLVFGAGAPHLAYSENAGNDRFGWESGQPLFEHFLLSKSVGDAGWRLRYFMPRNQVIKDVLPKLVGGAFFSLLILAVVVWGSNYIHRRILSPAKEQLQKLKKAVGLNQALMDVSPVGFALVRRQDNAMLLSNDLARMCLSSELLEVASSAGEVVVVKELCLDGGRVVHATFTPLRYGNEPSILCTLNDVTMLKHAEQTLLNAKREAENASEAKTVFFTTLSHEIRTPLYGVMGALELLALTATTHQQKQYLDALQSSSKALLSTVNNTLDLARIEAGQQSLVEESFSPLQLVEEVLSVFAIRAESKNLKLFAAVDAATPARVIGDAKVLRQILDNLVNNAIKFTVSGSVTVRLCSALVGEHAHFQFQVIDTGIGIEHKDLHRMFEPYFRASMDSAFHGTGLGLSICARLAELMQGTLKASSQLGLGTCVEFSLALPITVQAHENEMPVLLALPVYVRGAVPEVVSKTCGWLRRWGAQAVPYREDHSFNEAAILLETWPWAMPLGVWKGRSVIARPLTEAVASLNLYANEIEVNAYSLVGIGKGVRQAQDGHVEEVLSKHDSAIMGMRLLVVEDHPVTRMVLVEQLQQLGCNVEAVKNGQDALHLEQILEFDAIFTDINMPILNGYELAEKLRIRGYRKTIIGLTASIFSEVKNQYLTAGMNALLIKPLSINKIYQTLNCYSSI